MESRSIQCPCCEFNTGDGSDLVIAALLNAHVAGSHSQNAAPQQRRPPKVDRPVLKDNISEETWNAFVQSWDIFVRGNVLSDAEQTIQLYSACDMTLKAKLTAMNENIVQQPVQEVIDLLKSITVTPVALTVKRSELLQLHQDAGEKVRAFYSRVKGKAITCGLRKECTHVHANGTNNTPPQHVYVDFTDEWIKHVILIGLYDDEIRRDVFGQSNLDTMGINDLVVLIENKETARDAASTSSSTGSVSQYRAEKKKPPHQPQSTPARPRNIDMGQKGTCGTCGVSIKLYKRMSNGKINKVPFTDCQDCWKSKNSGGNHSRNTDSSSVSQDAAAITFDITCVQVNDDDDDDAQGKLQDTVNIVDVSSHHQAIEPCDEAPSMQNTPATSPHEKCTPTNADKANDEASISSVQLPIALRHHVFRDGNWRLNVAKPHPIIKLSIFTRKQDYDQFNLRYPKINTQDINAVTDSGAQCCLWGWSECQSAGFHRNDLIPVKQRLNGVSKSMNINIYGAILLRMFGTTSSGERVNCAVMVYVSPDVKGFYLSEEAMKQLRIIPSCFPNIGKAAAVVAPEECDCKPRTPTPGRPSTLPMKATVENIPEMKQWLLHQYASSTFNVCPHGPFPKIEGPPMRIHVDPAAVPKQSVTPSKVSLHMEEELCENLNKLEKQNVIEKIPHGVTTPWCHRLVTTRKEDGTMRMTVDLSPLNKHCTREVHPMKSPYESAKGIPPNTWRTVTDARDGFHSIPLHPDDRNLTAFLTPSGRYRFLRAVQGYTSSGDGYNR